MDGESIAERAAQVPIVLRDIKTSSWLDLESKRKNFFSCRKRKLPLAYQHFKKYTGQVAIVGNGPTLADQLEKLRAFDGKIIACGSGFPYLLSKGITPDFVIILDPSPLMAKCLKKIPQHTKYFIASHCDPSIFERLKNRRLFVWHAAGEINPGDHAPEPGIMGGSCTPLRAWSIAYNMGFTHIHFFGIDSCFDKSTQQQHADKDYIGPEMATFEANVTDPITNKETLGKDGLPIWYLTSPQMAAQAKEFATMLETFITIKGVAITVHGESLTHEYAKAMFRQLPAKESGKS